jgi:hypothetical protein
VLTRGARLVACTRAPTPSTYPPPPPPLLPAASRHPAPPGLIGGLAAVWAAWAAGRCAVSSPLKSSKTQMGVMGWGAARRKGCCAKAHCPDPGQLRRGFSPAQRRGRRRTGLSSRQTGPPGSGGGPVPKESGSLSGTLSGHGLGHGTVHGLRHGPNRGTRHGPDHRSCGLGRCWVLDRPVTRSGILLAAHGSPPSAPYRLACQSLAIRIGPAGPCRPLCARGAVSRARTTYHRDRAARADRHPGPAATARVPICAEQGGGRHSRERQPRGGGGNGWPGPAWQGTRGKCALSLSSLSLV